VFTVTLSQDSLGKFPRNLNCDDIGSNNTHNFFGVTEISNALSDLYSQS